ncbi:oligosaccharide flippase family protein [Carboxylicivirga sp. RSCT41]|uniref:oligosaccharide flippase family protein n=1 Tax=Carboxylicivirga agarovorans TaxID=3417570 RepID=UPI003D33BB7F
MSGNKQFLKNLGVNGGNFIVKMLLGLALPPFLISQLGLSAFGIIQVAISTAAYAALLSTSLNQANNRFVSVCIVRKDWQETSKVLTTIFILYILALVIVLPCIIYISFNLTDFFNVDSENVETASYMFLFVAISQVLVMFNTALSSPIYANNRLDIIQGINILRNALKVILVFVTVLLINASLVSVGLAFLIAAIISTVIAFIAFKKFVPFYEFKLIDFDRERLKSVFNLSAWTGISVVGAMIFSQTDIILINVLLGAEKAGEYAILVQWSVLLISVSTILSGVIAPNILIEYANKNIEKLKGILYQSIRYQGVFSAFASAMVFVYADVILKLWVGEQFDYLAPYLRVMVIHFGVSLAFRQIYTLNTAFNKMKFQGITTILFGGLHIIISVVLLKFTDIGIMAVIISGAVIYFILHVIVLPLYAVGYLKDSLKNMYLNVIPSLITISLVCVVGYIIKILIVPGSWMALTLSLVLTFVMVLVAIFYLVVTKEERMNVLKMYHKRFGK